MRVLTPYGNISCNCGDQGCDYAIGRSLSTVRASRCEDAKRWRLRLLSNFWRTAPPSHQPSQLSGSSKLEIQLERVNSNFFFLEKNIRKTISSVSRKNQKKSVCLFSEFYLVYQCVQFILLSRLKLVKHFYCIR